MKSYTFEVAYKAWFSELLDSILDILLSLLMVQLKVLGITALFGRRMLTITGVVDCLMVCVFLLLDFYAISKAVAHIARQASKLF